MSSVAMAMENELRAGRWLGGCVGGARGTGLRGTGLPGWPGWPGWPGQRGSGLTKLKIRSGCPARGSESSLRAPDIRARRGAKRVIVTSPHISVRANRDARLLQKDECPHKGAGAARTSARMRAPETLAGRALRAAEPVSVKRKGAPSKKPEPSFARSIYDEFVDTFQQAAANQFVQERQLRLQPMAAAQFEQLGGPARPESDDALGRACVRVWFRPAFLQAFSALDPEDRAVALSQMNGAAQVAARTQGSADMGYDLPAEIVFGGADVARAPPEGAAGFVDLSYRALSSAMHARARADAPGASTLALRGLLNPAYADALEAPDSPPKASLALRPQPAFEFAGTGTPLSSEAMDQPPALVPAPFMRRMVEQPLSPEQAQALKGAGNFAQTLELLERGYDPRRGVFAADYELILVTVAEFGRLWLDAAGATVAAVAPADLAPGGIGFEALESALERAGCLDGPFRQPVVGSLGGARLLGGDGSPQSCLLLQPESAEALCAAPGGRDVTLFRHLPAETSDYDERWHSSPIAATTSAREPRPWHERVWALLRALGEAIEAPEAALGLHAPPVEAEGPKAAAALVRLCANPVALLRSLTVLPHKANLKRAAAHFEALQQASDRLFDAVGDVTALMPLWGTALVARRLERTPPLCALDLSADSVPFVGAFAVALRVYTPFNDGSNRAQPSFVEMRAASGPSQALDNELRCFALDGARLLRKAAVEAALETLETLPARAAGSARTPEPFDAYLDGYWEPGGSIGPVAIRPCRETEHDPGHERDARAEDEDEVAYGL